MTPCYCKSGLLFSACCEPFITGAAVAATAEQLMRSRYSAFGLCDEDYLKQTWHSSTRPTHLGFEPQQNWLGLKIIATHKGGAQDETGQVEFVARYKVHGRAYRLHENSEFVLDQGRWYYVHGELFDQ